MKKFFAPAIFVLILLVSAAGCKKDKNCSDGSTNFPFLANGHQIVIYLDDYLSGIDTETITLGAKSNGKYPTTTTFAQNVLGTGTQYGSWWACGMDYYTSYTTDPTEGNTWWISLNSNVGDHWTRQEGGSLAYYQLIAKNVTVTTIDLGQTFTNCYEITYNQQNTFNVDTMYFRPDKGVVYYNGLLATYEEIK